MRLTVAQRKLLEWLEEQKSNSDDGWVCDYPAQYRVIDALVINKLVERESVAGQPEYKINASGTDYLNGRFTQK